jgi:hypothetical protein
MISQKALLFFLKYVLTGVKAAAAIRGGALSLTQSSRRMASQTSIASKLKSSEGFMPGHKGSEKDIEQEKPLQDPSSTFLKDTTSSSEI